MNGIQTAVIRFSALVALCLVCARSGPIAAAPASGPLSGIVRVGEAALGGVTVVIRVVTDGGGATIKFLKTEADGTFVLPDAPRGAYTFLALVPGLPALTARILHSAAPEEVSFVRLDLPAAGGILPTTARGNADPWNARAILKGDVLRNAGAILAALDEAPPEDPAPVLASLAETNASARLPVRASVASTTGFGGSGAATLSKTSLGVSGSLGGTLRWGVEGEYARLAPGLGLRSGDATAVAVDLAAGDRHALRVATSRQSRALDEADLSRFSAYSVDWSSATGDRAQAQVSARLVSQTRAFADGPAADLFANASEALDVIAGYRTEFNDRFSVRASVAYRSLTLPPVPAGSVVASAWDRETRFGATLGMQVVGALSIEAGATADVSAQNRGVTPELTLRFSPGAFRAWASAARRADSWTDTILDVGQVGHDVADLSRRSRSFYGLGVRYEGGRAAVSLEASRREILGTYRLLLSTDFFDRLDSLYFFPGDVATEIAPTLTGRLAEGVNARVGGRVGRISGEREGMIQSDQASFGIAEAAVYLATTRTTIGVGYRTVSQELTRGGTVLRNDLSAVDVSLAQMIPLPILRSLDSEWRALLNVELGTRRQGEDVERSNRRLAGGLAVSF